jgi:hypothetical protein
MTWDKHILVVANVTATSPELVQRLKASHDEIIVATLPMRFSKWLHAGLPERISRLTGAPVSHVISQPHPDLEVVPAPPHQSSPLGPLDAFGWGAGHIEGG